MSDWFPPSEPDYGNDCGACFPAGLTPSTFSVNFSGIQRGELWAAWMGQPPNGLHWVVQEPASACNFWDHAPPVPICRYSLFGKAYRLIYQINGTFAFYNAAAPACSDFFTNAFAAWPGVTFYGGEAVVMTSWEAQGWIEDITPIVDPDPLLRISPLAGNRAVISYIDEWGDTKIKLLVDRT